MPATSLDHYRTLVLDRAFQPLRAISWERAITLDLTNRVEVLEVYDAVVRTAAAAFPLPAVIRMPAFFRRMPNTVALTRRNVLIRDAGCCQYCAATPSIRDLTLDHVVPRSRGGRSTWENLVTACGPCNRRKGSRTPEEAGMALRARPARPDHVVLGRRDMVVGAPPPQWVAWLA